MALPALGAPCGIVMGDLVFVDENDKVLAIENWKTALQRYLAYCEKHGIKPQDLTAFR
jgi:2,4'-dihydroxyacetophenone dioxygenase